MTERIDLVGVTRLPDRSLVVVRATVRHLQLKRNVMGELWAALSIEDVGFVATVLVFAKTFACLSWDGVEAGAVCDLLVQVRLAQDGTPKLRLDSLSVVSTA
ncbi:hypothetical protein [Allobranchiibius sp. CTAmp26]|uniref:hypothetical protein n=1 Tax=Allobranchiibius sp. CTAmp26 TaxID=2815214 RepID=UPI001AA179E6|nr:hypothetical protein [Allobranchiibius sp. CTAmp26]MBO1756447.1 hypothetical protein [Allobranchiibius sp. CTAmp26]